MHRCKNQRTFNVEILNLAMHFDLEIRIHDLANKGHDDLVHHHRRRPSANVECVLLRVFHCSHVMKVTVRR